jgi:hypothetical protein
MNSLPVGAAISDHAAPGDDPVADAVNPASWPRQERSALGDSPGEPQPKCHHPSTAPAYYLSRPASFWITVMHARRKPTTSQTCTARRTYQRRRG